MDKKNFYRGIALNMLDTQGILLYKLKTGRLSIDLEFEIMKYLGVSKLLDAIQILSMAKNYIFGFSEEWRQRWLVDEQNKKVVALNKAKNIIKKAYETQYILK